MERTNVHTHTRMTTHGTQNDNNTPKFPTGKTVPFPYDHPYPQQVDLMDTLLQSLSLQIQPKDDQKQREEEQEQQQREELSFCPVYMLESPTGTGKSLSLACASLAWLRHTEQEAFVGSSTFTSTTMSMSTSSRTESDACTDHSNVDWIDSWVPPQIRKEQEDQEEMRTKAKKTRQQLNQVLMELQQRRRRQQQQDLHCQQQRQRIRIQQLKADLVRQSNHGTGNQPFKRYKRFQQLQQNYTDENNGKDVVDTSSIDPATRLLEGSHLDGSCTARASATPSATPSAINHVAAGSGVRKIIYAARTHSQLSQFVHELQGLVDMELIFGDNINDDKKSNLIRVVALGGRKILCGHPDLQGKPESILNEACLDMSRGKPTQKCPLLHRKQDAMDQLALHMLVYPVDIEEAATTGRHVEVCSYYATRRALTAAEVVVLPYSMLVSQETRQSIGLETQNALILIDEAHNLASAVQHVHSCTLTLPVLQQALDQLQGYTDIYAHRLNGRNLSSVSQLKRILLAFKNFLSRLPKDHTTEPNKNNISSNSRNSNSSQTTTISTKMMTPTEFLLAIKAINMNVYATVVFLQTSRLSQKLMGFSSTTSSNTSNADTTTTTTSTSTTGLSKHVSAMSMVQTFLEKVAMANEGKIVADWPTTTTTTAFTVSTINREDRSENHNPHDNNHNHAVPQLRYVVLHPSKFIEPILRDAHALVLVGGTIRPFSHMATELFQGYTQLIQEAQLADQLMQRKQQNWSKTKTGDEQKSTSYIRPTFTAFCCDHVVPSSNVLLQYISKGGTNNTRLDFRHVQRTDTRVMDALGETLLSLMRVTPHGMVVFLPSYSYEAQLVTRWKQTKLWEGMSTIKRIFREPKTSTMVEATLQAYAKAVMEYSSSGHDGSCRGRNSSNCTTNEKAGAILLAVIGGKLSEGINFANELCRCVVVVGLPYPNLNSPELQEKMRALDDDDDDDGNGGGNGHSTTTMPAAGATSTTSSRRATLTGQTFYFHLCMRALNQSIGRAIRHANDYSAVVLVDQRYQTDTKVQAHLPPWLQRGLSQSSLHNNNNNTSDDLSVKVQELQRFFLQHKQQ